MIEIFFSDAPLYCEVHLNFSLISNPLWRGINEICVTVQIFKDPTLYHDRYGRNVFKYHHEIFSSNE